MTQETAIYKHATTEEKLSAARGYLIKLCKKFSYFIDTSVLKELDRIATNLEVDFVTHRPSYHLAKLAYSIYLIRKKLVKNLALSPLSDCYDLRFIPFSLQFTFGTKPVLGILAHAHLRDKYEVFNEDHMLLILRKTVPDAQILKGSTYIFQAQTNNIKTLYFEVDKKSGLPFTAEEITLLKKLLKQEMQFCVEQLVPQLFMVRNEEEVLRNILTLSREIHHVSDLPQVMILFDEQTSQEAIFTVILVRALQKEMPTAHECLARLPNNFSYVIDRCQIVKYLRKKHPIEANVYKIILGKDISVLRGDLSLNFYLARQKISQAITDSFGEHRDYNGGVILKQREALSSFMETLPDVPFQNSELPENFFHSLSPIESQATLSIKSLKNLYRLFLKALNSKIINFSDYFLDFDSQDGQFFIVIRYSDKKIKDTIGKIFTSFQVAQNEIISSTLNIQNTHFLGFLIFALKPKVQEQLLQAIAQALKEWKWNVENQQVLKFGLEPTPISLDPRVGGDQISSLILKLLFEGLMRENKEGKIDYGLACKVDISSDLKTYLFHLRSTQWSDGSSVSAFDFEYAWKKVLSPDFKTPYAYLFYPIKNAKSAKDRTLPPDAIGIKALDELTLQVDLESPTPYFLELTAHTIYSPVNRTTDKLHPNWSFEDEEAYVCNGAFQLTKNSKDSGYELIKNALYWDVENIQLNQVVFVKANRYQSYELFNQNNNHWIGAPLATWDPNFVPKECDDAVDFSDEGVYWYVFNTQRFPFNHKKLRQAMAMAIDRSKLQALLNVKPAFSPLPPLHSQINTTFLSQSNIERAKVLFAEALRELGLSHQTFPSISMIHSTGPVRNKIAEFVKQEWESVLGIQCIVEPLKWNSLFSKMFEGDYQVGGMGWQSWVNDPLYTLNSFKNCKELINFSKWENILYQEILNFAEREVDHKVRESYYLQAEKLLLDEMPVIPIYCVVCQALKKKSLIVPHVSMLMNFKWAHFLPSDPE